MANDGWISVAERLPEDEVTVLAVVGPYHWLARYVHGRGWYGLWENEYWHTPTHWQPLPPLPTDEKED